MQMGFPGLRLARQEHWLWSVSRTAPGTWPKPWAPFNITLPPTSSLALKVKTQRTFKKIIILFIYIYIWGHARSWLLWRLFSGCDEWGRGALLSSCWRKECVPYKYNGMCVQASHCGSFSSCGAWALGTQASVVAAGGLRSFSFQSTGSMVAVHRLRCSTACGIFLNQGSDLGLLHWQADSLPLSHQESPESTLRC